VNIFICIIIMLSNCSQLISILLFLFICSHAMSSVLHVLARFVKMIEADTRNSLYKSVSKFWSIYRNSNHINANIMFTLREIRNCLRMIKDDLSNVPVSPTKVFETIIKVMQSEYLAAFVSFINILDVSNTKKTFFKCYYIIIII